MIRPIFRLIASALVLAGFCLSPAAAPNAMPARPVLRANVTVIGEIVRIGDLVANAGPVADVPIFRAPDLGTRGMVATERVLDAIRPHQLVGIDTRGLAEVVVTRASRTITPHEISARVVQALADQYGLGAARNTAISFDQTVRTLHIEADAKGPLEVAALSYEAQSGRFDVIFDLPSSAVLRRLAPHYSGTAVATVDAVMVARPVERGEVLRTSDLVIGRLPKRQGTAIGDMRAAVGWAARRALRPGDPLHETDLMKPLIVHRDDIVVIVYEAPGLRLTLRGKARQDGTLGAAVNVVNMESKRLLQGVVSGPGRVTVSAAPTQIAANTPTVDLPAPPSVSPAAEHGAFGSK